MSDDLLREEIMRTKRPTMCLTDVLLEIWLRVGTDDLGSGARERAEVQLKAKEVKP